MTNFSPFLNLLIIIDGSTWQQTEQSSIIVGEQILQVFPSLGKGDRVLKNDFFLLISY